MNPAARAFWRRYHLLTVLLPAYALALLHYGIAAHVVRRAAGWAPGTLPLELWGWPLLLGLLGLFGYFRILPLLGFLWSGVPRRRADDPVQADRLGLLLRSTGLPLLDVTLLDLGEAPFLAVARARPRGRLWISRWTARSLGDGPLRCLLAHEQAHIALLPLVLDWPMLAWLAAFPLCWLSAGYPLAWPALAALQVSLQLRWQARLTLGREAAADQLAAQAVGRAAYAAALAAYLAQAEQPGGTALRRARLRGLGLDSAEVARLLAGTPA